ncbi:MAG: phosphoenolpyruvate carboxykinase (ATP) [Myxococcales bacterium]|nr:phosphoenolpyruvate carboxykinase (ATP) [Myxococcales bacterium]
MDLSKHGITVGDIRRNLSPAKLYEEAIRHESGARIADSGALIAYSGLKTGRSPKDKRIVREEATQDDIWWGDVNRPVSKDVFDGLQMRVAAYLDDATTMLGAARGTSLPEDTLRPHGRGAGVQALSFTLAASP